VVTLQLSQLFIFAVASPDAEDSGDGYWKCALQWGTFVKVPPVNKTIIFPKPVRAFCQ
jgi:hypothetical protein